MPLMPDYSILETPVRGTRQLRRFIALAPIPEEPQGSESDDLPSDSEDPEYFSMEESCSSDDPGESTISDDEGSSSSISSNAGGLPYIPSRIYTTDAIPPPPAHWTMSEEDADDEGGEDNNEDYMDHDEDDEVDEDDGDDGFSSYLLVDSSGECRGILAATEYRETEGEDFEVVLLWPFSIRGHSLSYDP